MKKILYYCKPYSFYIAITLMIKIVGTLMDLVIPYLLGYILDEVVPLCTKEHLTPVFWWGGAMVLCALVAVTFNVYANRRTAKFSANVVQCIRQDMFDKILSLSAAQTDRFTIPSLVSRMSSDSYSIHGMLNMLFRGGFRAPILLVGGLFVTLTIEPVLALAFIVLVPILLLVITFISKKGIALFKAKQKKVDTMVEKIRDTFTGVRVIKALSKVPHEKEEFARINEDLSHSEEKANIVMGASRPIFTIFLNLGMTAMVALGAWRVHGGYTAPGQIISFMSYFNIILNSTLALTRIFTVCSRGIASGDRIGEVLDEKEDLAVLMQESAEENAPYLEFRDVTFSYNKTIPTISHISFTLEKGQTLGIIGGTGSGKTTLIQLLLRFYDPDEGQILLEGKDLRSYPPEVLRKKFGVIFQHDFLMAESIRANVLFERDLSEEALNLALESAQASSFVREKENGTEYLLTTKGANLSGGQRQRVLISRALAGSSEILILDDASSALDYKTDADLRTAIHRNYRNTTCVVVAQRVSSIKNSDLILVLEHGELIGKGTHESLSEACSIYQEIAHSQMGEVNA